MLKAKRTSVALAAITLLLGVIAIEAMTSRQEGLVESRFKGEADPSSGATSPAPAPALPIPVAARERLHSESESEVFGVAGKTLEPGAVKGRLFDAEGKLCPNYLVTFTPDPEARLGTDKAPRVQTGREGQFAIDAIPPGIWHVLVERADKSFAARTRLELATLEVVEGRVANLDLFLPGTRRLSGHLMLEEPKGMGLRLELFHRHRNEIFATARASNRDPRALRKYRDGREIPESRRAGYFEFTDVPSGEYTLRIFPDVELPPDVADMVSAEEVPIDLTDGDVTVPERVFELEEFGMYPTESDDKK